MRTAVTLVSIAFIMFGLAGNPEAQALNDKDIAKLVDDFVAEGTSDSRREEIELKLLRVKPALTTKPIKAALGVDKKRAAALGLAITLWTPGVFPAVKRYTDGELCPQIVKLGLSRQEKEAVDHLFERWKQAATDSTEFSAITEGFKASYVDLSYLDKMKASLEKETDEARKTAGGEILSFQLGVEAGSLQDVLDGWNASREPREKYGKRFPMEGRDISRHPDWRRQNAGSCGQNWVLTSEGSQAYIGFDQGKGTPAELQIGNWRINIRVLIKTKDVKFRCSIASTEGAKTTGPTLWNNGKEWYFPDASGNNTGTAPTKVETWFTVSFVIKDQSDANQRQKRTVATLLDEKKIDDKTILNGAISYLSLVAEAGVVVISGVEIIPV
jgi:hypothetical protein